MDQNKVAVSVLDTRRVHPAQKWLHKLDVGAFGVDLAARLNDQCVGYVILPGGLPFALLANSQVGNDVSVIDIVRQAAKAHVIPGL